MKSSHQTRTYYRESSVVFLKTHEPFGGLSNMAGGFPLCVNGSRILTSEALYQLCRFPRLPDVQRLIIEQNSPMTTAFMRRELELYIPDAWIKESANKIGYEVSFTHHIDKLQPLCIIEEITADIFAIE